MRTWEIKTDHKKLVEDRVLHVMQWVGYLYERKKNLMLPKKEINIHAKNYPRVRCDNLAYLFPQMCPEF